MKRIVNLIIISLFTFLFSNCSSAQNNVEILSVAEFKQMIAEKGDDIVVLDVRTEKEVKEGKIEGAVQLDFRSNDFKDKVGLLDKNKTYMLYCRSGRRSNEAAIIMSSQGFTQLYDLKGGIIAWKAAGEQID